jgi:DNA-binding winged helix-turn-helix (wHTH) protein
MAANDPFTIGAFRFDARTGDLWRDGLEAARLTPRAAAVLAMLAGRAQDVVTK